MSTTDQRTGFRLPWNTESRAPDGEAEAAEAAPEAAATATDAAATATDAPAPATDAPAPEAAAEAASASDSAEPGAAGPETFEAGEDMSWPEVDRRVRQSGRRAADATAGRGPTARGVSSTDVLRHANPLMAVLSKAMHAAAESARAETIERLAADANARIEAIRSGSADEAASIKQAGDADIAAARDWSKAELTRIREETERRITARRSELEKEVEAHTARVERRIERVRRMVAGFETQMTSFFETLLAEEDPTQVAFLAEQLPEPPSLELDDELEDAFEAFEAEGEVVAPTKSDTGAEVVTEAEVVAEAEVVTEAEVVAEAAVVAQAEVVTEAEVVAEDPASEVDAGVASPELSPEGAAAAEAEALAALEGGIPADADMDAVDGVATDPSTMPDDIIAARLAKMDSEAVSTARTELIVTGLVSVAGIAGFKRAVSRITGVSAVGVTSGPGGEFVYAVTHGPETDFNSAISALPGFAARLTGESEGVIRVTANDRDADR